jgi:hypothetical protein
MGESVYSSPYSRCLACIGCRLLESLVMVFLCIAQLAIAEIGYGAEMYAPIAHLPDDDTPKLAAHPS